MASWLGWIPHEFVHVRQFWRIAAAVVVLTGIGSWNVKSYLDSTEKTNLRSEAAVLRAQLESEIAAHTRTQGHLKKRDGEVALFENQLDASNKELEALRTQLRVQSNDEAHPTEISGAWAELGLSREEFGDLPLHWRQALAELAVAPRTDFRVLGRFVKELRPNDILLIDRVAPAMAHNGTSHFLVRSRTSPQRHPQLELEFADFQRLREIGLLHPQSSRTGVRISPSDAHPVSIWGSSVALALYSSEGDAVVELPIETFTVVGAAVVELLRVPSDLRYFAWIADTIRDSTLDAQLWAFSRFADSPEAIVPGMGRIEMARLR